MLKQLKVSLVLGLTALGALTYSCQKQNDPAAEIIPNQTVKLQPITSAELVKVMSSDQLVKDFISANEAFLTKYDKWVTSLPSGVRTKYREELREASKTGKTLKETFRTEEEVNTHHAKQAERAQQIKAKYPQLYQLSDDEQEKVKAQVFRSLTMRESTSSATAGDPSTNAIDEPTVSCHDGYNACSWSCYDHGGATSCYNACSAGYKACTGG